MPSIYISKIFWQTSMMLSLHARYLKCRKKKLKCLQLQLNSVPSRTHTVSEFVSVTNVFLLSSRRPDFWFRYFNLGSLFLNSLTAYARTKMGLYWRISFPIYDLPTIISRLKETIINRNCVNHTILTAWLRNYVSLKLETIRIVSKNEQN